MARPRHYSPALERFLVSVLYFEAKRQKVPMTQLANGILKQSLTGSEAWKEAETAWQLQEKAIPYRTT